MKRKVSIILALAITGSMLLTGCANPLDKFKKDKTVEESTEVVEEDNRVSVIGSGAYTVGDTVTIDDIVSVSADVAGDVTQKVILDDMGQISDTLDTSATGEYSVSIVVEFIDGTGWSDSYSYVVEGPTGDEQATSLYNSYDGHTIITGQNGTNVTAVYRTSDMSLTDDETTMISLVGQDKIVRLFTTDTDSNIASRIEDLKQSYAVSLDSYKQSLIDSGETISDEDSAKYDLAKDVYTQLLENIIGDTTETEVGKLYSLDGTQVTVSEVTASLMYSRITGQVSDDRTYPIGYLLKDSSTSDIIYVEVVPLTESTSLVPLNDDDNLTYTNYDEFLAGVKEIVTSDRIPTFSSVVPYDSLTGMILAGRTTGESETVTTEDNAIEVETSEEEETVSDAIKSAKQTYESKYPQVYKWPENSLGTQYSRWDYIIDEETTFTTTIILADGTAVTSDSDSDISINTNSSNGATGISSASSAETSNEVMRSLVSSYGTYTVSNTDIPDALIDTESSTSSVIKLSYNGNVYYIETARTSTISNYQKTCIYSTSDMSSADYTIAADESKATTTSVGKITPYSITYNDTNNKEQVKGYMAVYNINNDYLVIYADNMDKDTTTMTDLLSKLISK